MTDIDPSSPYYVPPSDTGNTPGTGETAQKDEQTDGKLNVAEEARRVVDSHGSPHPLEADTIKKAEEFEQKRQSDLDEERAEHIRQRGNVTR